jgi:hypothetical protein
MVFTTKDVRHPSLCTEFLEKWGDSPFLLEDRFSVGHCSDAIRQVLNWPLFAQLAILEQALQRPISSTDEKKLRSLEQCIQSFKQHPVQQVASSTEERSRYEFKILTRDDQDYFMDALETLRTCYKRRKLRGVTGRILADIELGGTIAYILEKDGTPVVYNKLFVCPTKTNGGIFLFYDAIENGKWDTNTLKQWMEPTEDASEGRLNQLVYCVAMAGYMAAQLDIGTVQLADRELDELGRHMGSGRSQMLPRDDRKIGWLANYQNKGEVVYQARLFHNKGNKFRRFDVHFSRTAQQIRKGFYEVYQEMSRKRFNPRRLPRFKFRLYYLFCANRIIQEFQSGTSGLRANMVYNLGDLADQFETHRSVLIDPKQ